MLKAHEICFDCGPLIYGGRAINVRRLNTVLAFALFAGGCQRDANTAERGKLQGNWEVVTAERLRDGQPQKFTQPNIILMFEGDKLIMRMGNEPKNYTYRLDPKQNPRHMDTTQDDGRTAFGIYEIMGDDLKLIQSNTERPTDFSVAGDRVLMTLRRIKK